MNFTLPERAADYVRHMLQAIENILAYTADMAFAHFKQSGITCDAVIRNIELIGEAASQLHKKYPDYTKQYPHIPWLAIIGMRNRIIHGYFTIDLAVVWKTIQSDLAPLQADLSAIISTQDHRVQKNVD